MAVATAETRESSPRVSMGPEIANAWGWLLNRAPRIARALEALPGAPAMMASVLAGVDLVIHQEFAGDERAFARKYQLEVSTDFPNRVIFVKMVPR